jgi:methanogenic corrinoid protein MtbC1
MQADIEFLIQRIERLREEQALKPVYTMVGSAAIVIAWIELFRRHCL